MNPLCLMNTEYGDSKMKKITNQSIIFDFFYRAELLKKCEYLASTEKRKISLSTRIKNRKLITVLFVRRNKIISLFFPKVGDAPFT